MRTASFRRWQKCVPYLVVLTCTMSDCQAARLLDPTKLEKFVDPLPSLLKAPLTADANAGDDPAFEITIGQFSQRLHRDLAPTTLWGYNGMFPGPTLVAERGQRIKVKWVNQLVDQDGRPLNHLLPYDTTVHGASPSYPQARAVTHLHGAITDAASDGFPEHWFTPNPEAAANNLGGPSGNSHVTTYDNEQPATALWYHDHAMGITRLNVYAGMAGLYLLRDEHERALNLPSGDYEIPLLIQDRSFYDNGQLYYPTGPHDLGNHANVEVTPTSHASDFAQPTVVPHFVGNTNLVNGVVWPYLEVEPRKYRFRIVNGANSRHYDLSLVGPDDQQVIFHQIGTDGGLLAHPVDRTRVLLAPADRADVVVDFSTFSIDQELLLRNLAPDGFSLHHAAQPADPSTTGQVIRLRVVPAKGPDDSSLPSRLINIRRLKESNAVRSRRFELVEAIDHHGRPVMLLDGKHWSDPVSAIARLGETEIWEIENFTAFPHPIHLHATQFQLLDRVNRQTGPVELAEYELGWEDTVTVNPRERVRIIVPFEQFSGTFVWHCHMLEHEDHEMMRPFQVVAPEPNSLQLLLLSTALARVAGPFRFRRRVGASAKRGE